MSTTAPGSSSDVRRRSSLLGADQLISSASNFVTTLAVASISAPAEFGAYALAGSLFALALAASRMTSSERLVLESGHGRVALLTSSLLGVTALSVVSSVILWRTVGEIAVLAWAAAVLPILAQDRLRFVALAKRPIVALAGDLLWLVLTGASWLAVVVVDVAGGQGSVLITAVPPLVAVFVMAILLREETTFRIESDAPRFRAEFHFVLDPWIQAGAVFAGLGIAASIGSLETVGQARVLILIFQPFVSISYVGRLMVLRSREELTIRRWPIIAAACCGVYSILLATLAVILRPLDFDPGDLWSFGPSAFALMAIAQCARAFHQSVADLLRRSVPGRLVPARLLFAFVLVTSIGPLVAWRELDGLTVAWAIAYLGGAVAIRPAWTSNRQRSSVSSVGEV